MRTLNGFLPFFLLLIFATEVYSQAGFSDDFSDGNFNANPIWIGETAKFQIDAANQLQLNDVTASDPAYLVTNSTVINSASWEFFVEMDFSPSGSNYGEVYLVSSQQDLTQNLDGYFVRIGGVSGAVDDVSLYRQDGSNQVEIIDGIDGIVGQQPVKVKVRVTKDMSGQWELFADTSVAGNNYVSQGTATDLTHPQSAFFGVLCHYTSTRSDKFFFDDFVVNGQAFQDTIKPQADSLLVLDSNSLELRFSEFLDLSSATVTTNFTLLNGGVNPTAAAIDASDSSRLVLDFSSNFVSGTNYNLEVKNLADRNGNVMTTDTVSFFYFVPVPANQRDIVINEFYPDPSPSNGLPSGEFVEIYNASNKVFDLNGWEIADGSSSRSLPSHILQPNGYVIICNSADASAYQSFGTVVPVSSLPTLNNGGDDLRLEDNSGNTIDQLSYDLSWYQDPSRDGGGWSIEQINPKTPCIGANNFTASNASIGGTPGQQNSVYDTTSDLTAPQVTQVTALSEDSVLVQFNEFMDSTSVVNGNYTFTTSAVVGQVFNQPPSYDQALLVLSTPLDSGKVDTLIVSNVNDCSGNLISGNNLSEVVLPAEPAYRDVVINEFYPDPTPSIGLPQADFIELYNASNKIFDLNGWQIEDASSGGSLSSQIFRPGDYIILCPLADVSAYQSFGFTMGVQSFPSLNNTGDQIKLFDNQGNMIDRLSYSKDWYQDLTKDDGGWSLEQINPLTECTGKNNFIASNNIQGGTPGTQNSVYDTTADQTSPALLSAQALSADSVLLRFNEPLDTVSVLSATYTFSTSASVASAQNRFPTYTEVLLLLNSPLDSGVVNTITVTNILDCPGNSIGSQNQAEIVVPASPNYRDVVINEFMCDPSPQVGLPDAEFIELYNASQKIFDLSNWTLGDGSTVSTLENLIFRPGDYIIICSEGSEMAFSAFGPTQGQSSFPALTNSGDEILLRDQKGQLIDYISYTDQWYQNEDKKNGGYTLEQINPNLPCNGSYNFIASNAGAGGTPGRANSVLDQSPDLNSPTLGDILVFSADTIELRFNEGVDTNSTITATYSFNPPNVVADLIFEPQDVSKIKVVLVNPLDSGVLVSLNIQGIEDCSGNQLDENERFSLALPEMALANDLVINEILFNPRTGGSDFVELFNRSNKVVSLQNWMMANWDDDSIANRELIINEPYLVFPGEYVGLSENVDNIVNEYPATVRDVFIEINDLPSYNDDEGGVYVLDAHNNLIDSFRYDEDQHFELLNDEDGVSLERLDPNRPSADWDNFHSASERVGFATPGYQNSQFFPDTRFDGQVSLDPESFSPDNDGFQDILNVNYQFGAPGYLANVKIYDRGGRLVKNLVNNELLGSSGTFSWDGITNEATKARVGIYVLHFQAINPSGDEQVFKETFVLAARLD